MWNTSRVLILDFGSQYTQLIARSVREAKVYCEIQPYDWSWEKVETFQPNFIILSGGPESITQDEAPRLSFHYSQFEKNEISVLGICYGMQLMARENGGVVSQGKVSQFGFGKVKWLSQELSKVSEQNVWLSHGDHVETLPKGFELLASTDAIKNVVMIRKQSNRQDIGFQFHPEVQHTEGGKELLHHILKTVGHCKPDWDAGHIRKFIEAEIGKKVGTESHVLMGLSGGVDSSVAAVLISNVIGERLHCVFIDNGLLRLNESEQVLERYKALNLSVDFVKAGSRFLKNLEGISDPEKKRKVIGHTFIEEFRTWSLEQTECQFLGQGTLYPDVIESVSVRGPSHTIKTHHNVGGLPKNLPFKLIEPLRELFKDEVRTLGHELGIPSEILNRHPFPGPGLAVRIMGEVTEEKLKLLRQVDAIFINEIEAAGLTNEIWQALAVLTDTQSVGVKGDARDYGPVVALRAVTSRDAMTADWYPFSSEFLKQVSTKILNEVREVTRVVLDITSKPPGTIEWE